MLKVYQPGMVNDLFGGAAQSFAMTHARPTPARWLPAATDDGTFGAGQTERCIEGPWASHWIEDSHDILDIGFSLSHIDWLRILLRQCSGDVRLSAVDIITPERVANRYPADLQAAALSVPIIIGDVRTAPVPERAFDTVTCISTIEHVGFDATGADETSAFARWDTPEETPDSRDPAVTADVLAAFARALRPGGRALVTVPMGKGGAVLIRDSLGFYTRQLEYDSRSWDEIIRAEGFRLLEQRFFRWVGERGWREVSSPDDLADQTAWLTPHATGVALAALERQP